MEFLNEFILPVITGICLCTGYIVKQWLRDVDNRYIPGICAVLGIILSAWINGWTLTPQIILEGMVSGLASTGMHQLFKQYLESVEGRKLMNGRK